MISKFLCFSLFEINSNIAKIPILKFHILVGSKKNAGLNPPKFIKKIFKKRLNKVTTNMTQIKILIFLKNLTEKKNRAGKNI